MFFLFAVGLLCRAVFRKRCPLDRRGKTCLYKHTLITLFLSLFAASVLLSAVSRERFMFNWGGKIANLGENPLQGEISGPGVGAWFECPVSFGLYTCIDWLHGWFHQHIKMIYPTDYLILIICLLVIKILTRTLIFCNIDYCCR